MGLKQCHECKKDVSTEAKTCPACGAPVKKPTSMSTLIIGGVILFLVVMAFIGGPSTNTSRTPTTGSDPSTATDAQIYREFEICMNNADKVIRDDKMRGQSLAANCMLGLQKYGDERAKKAFGTYFDLDMGKPKKRK